MALGTDWSNFQPIPMLADSQALLAAGFTFAIVGLQHEPTCEAQIAALRAGGITVEDCYIENTLNPPIPSGLKRGWVAVEEGSGITDEATIDSQIEWLRNAGLEAGIYTSTYMLEHLGLTSLFATKYVGVPLWLADYDGDGNSVPAGAAMKQYEVGTVAGLSYELDLDYRPDAPQEVDVEIRTLDQAESIAAINAAAASLGSALNDDGVTVVEVTGGLPDEVTKYLPTGGHAYLFTTKS